MKLVSVFTLSLAFLAPTFSSTTSATTIDPWIFLGQAGSGKHSVKDGTFEKTTNKEGEAVFKMVGRLEDGNKIDFMVWEVKESDCRKGMGKLVALDSNDVFIFRRNFAFDGGNASSVIAEFICEQAK